jgi:NADPH:quinone reductase-like Zn-dependent oxidoreductase
MRAIFQKAYGSTDVLEYGDVALPAIGPKQVLVEVHASSVNPRDWLIRSGNYQMQFLVPAFPLVLGSDISGVVTAVGSRARRFKPGEHVFGMKNPSEGLGAHAEFAAVNESALALKPANLDFEAAGGLPLCALTAWQALVDIADIQRGQRVLVIGASGGVGTFAVQIAKALGAVATGVCSATSQQLVESLGADRTIDYKRDDFKKMGDTYDIIFDTIGRESLDRCAANLVSGGIYVSTVPKHGNLVSMLTTSVRHFVFKSSKRCAVVMVKPDGKALAEISTLAQKGQLRTVVDSVFPLQDAKDAHALSRSQRAKGKVILQIKGSLPV